MLAVAVAAGFEVVGAAMIKAPAENLEDRLVFGLRIGSNFPAWVAIVAG